MKKFCNLGAGSILGFHSGNQYVLGKQLSKSSDFEMRTGRGQFIDIYIYCGYIEIKVLKVFRGGQIAHNTFFFTALLQTSRKHTYIILTPLNPTFI